MPVLEGNQKKKLSSQWILKNQFFIGFSFRAWGSTLKSTKRRIDRPTFCPKIQKMASERLVKGKPKEPPAHFEDSVA